MRDAAFLSNSTKKPIFVLCSEQVAVSFDVPMLITCNRHKLAVNLYLLDFNCIINILSCRCSCFMNFKLKRIKEQLKNQHRPRFDTEANRKQRVKRI